MRESLRLGKDGSDRDRELKRGRKEVKAKQERNQRKIFIESI